MTDQEIEEMGWKKGYNLTVWTDYCSEMNSRTMVNVVTRYVTGGRMGDKVGPGSFVTSEATKLREKLSSV